MGNNNKIQQNNTEQKKVILPPTTSMNSPIIPGSSHENKFVVNNNNKNYCHISPSSASQMISAPSLFDESSLSSLFGSISMDEFAPSANVEINTAQNLWSPSPPPQTTYICSPSPEMEW